ncbi:MAG: DUF444 family protein [Thermaerobacter sp.]|nr:DUF444 family protein [Thermaerobacter sp.]
MDPWGLDIERSAERDRARHQELLREALANHLKELVVEEALIGGGERGLRLSYPVLRERRLRFAQDEVQVEVVHRPDGAATGDHAEGRAGDQPGEEELEWLHERVSEELHRRWRLPELAGAPLFGSRPADVERLRRIGPWPNLHRRQSMLAAIRRARLSSSPVRLREEDLRFHTSAPDQNPAPDCLIVALRDVSGSMGDEKKLLCRSFFHWLVDFVRGTYGPIEIAYVVHHTEARRVEEEEFFRRVESGGTKVSSAYRVALELARAAKTMGRQVLVLHFTEGKCSLG